MLWLGNQTRNLEELGSIIGEVILFVTHQVHYPSGAVEWCQQRLEVEGLSVNIMQSSLLCALYTTYANSTQVLSPDCIDKL